MTLILSTKTHLVDAESLITSALERMIAKPHYNLPVVVVCVDGSDLFVQYAGSSTERILFDVPLLGIQDRPDGGTPESHARLGCAVMRGNFELPPEAILVIDEADQCGDFS